MKVRSYGALMGALLTMSTVDAAEAATCVCAPAPAKHAAVHRAPVVREDDGLSYAQSGYDYRSTSRVTEQFVRGGNVAFARQEENWQVAPNDAHIHFYRDEREVVSPNYPQPYYQPQAAYYPPPAYYGPPEPVEYDDRGLVGGVGYGGSGAGGGGGGGGGGQAFLYLGGSGGSDAPPNGGGVNLPGGYGPTYRGNWSGQGVPTMGGGASIGK